MNRSMKASPQTGSEVTGRVREIGKCGQSVWLDFIDRDLLDSGALERLVDEDGVSGLTSNPAIFEQAIAEGTAYDPDLAELLAERDDSAGPLFERLAVREIRRAADALMPVFRRSSAADGHVSLEVSPHLAFDSAATVAQARSLWKAVGRPNLMIKVPATLEGVAALRELIAEGINVNVTLLFSRERYRAVAQAYIEGVDAYVARHGDAAGIASVASFFVSRIDTAMDAMIEARREACTDAGERRRLKALLGRVAIANARLAYQDYLEVFSRSERWAHLSTHCGARPQRLLWASTGTKNPAYPDVCYVEALIGEATVNTVPPTTLEAFRDHGIAHPRLHTALSEALAAMDEIERLGLDFSGMTARLLDEGLALFREADDRLRAAVARKRATLLDSRLVTETARLGESLSAAVERTCEHWQQIDGVRRLWARDASLWTGADEASWLDWLDVVDDSRTLLPSWAALGRDLRGHGIDQIVLIGMGGSSLGAEALMQALGGQLGAPRLLVLDSTVPAQISALEATLNCQRALFIVASKSGSTLEVDILGRYFLERVRAELGRHAGAHFVAITDPGSALEDYAREHRFLRVFHGLPKIGGRYSVLSAFGMVPAALGGHDVTTLLDAAQCMVNSCAESVPAAENPGVRLGITLGEAARIGRDKLTILSSSTLRTTGAWIEQLVAESTGKHGRGLVPVDAEPVGDVAAYGADRLFVVLQLAQDEDAALAELAEGLAKAGHPVLVFTLHRPEQICQAFFLWQVATAVAGSLLEINPFDQPDVESAKAQTRALMEQYTRCGTLPPTTPVEIDTGVSAEQDAPAAAALQDLLAQLRDDDYVALLAYVERCPAHMQALQGMRAVLRDTRRIATCLGFGPRFLHSTGQLYKGGVDQGVFLQITCDDAQDLQVPGRDYHFGVVKAAQAAGDLAVLQARARRVLHVHLRGDVGVGLERLRRLIDSVAQEG